MRHDSRSHRTHPARAGGLSLHYPAAAREAMMEEWFKALASYVALSDEEQKEQVAGHLATLSARTR